LFERSAEEKPSVLITVACFSSSSIDFPGQNLHIGGVCVLRQVAVQIRFRPWEILITNRERPKSPRVVWFCAHSLSRVAPLARLLRSPSQCRAINKIWGDYRRLECDPRFTLSVFMGWMKLAKRRALRFLAAAALRSLVFFSPCSIICAHHFYSLSHKQAERILRASVLCYLHLSLALADKFISIAADGTRFLLALARSLSIARCSLRRWKVCASKSHFRNTHCCVCCSLFSAVSLSSAPSIIQI
jgi:hypothetical protein